MYNILVKDLSSGITARNMLSNLISLREEDGSSTVQ